MNEIHTRAQEKTRSSVTISIADSSWNSIIHDILEGEAEIHDAGKLINGKYADIYICDEEGFAANYKHLKDLKRGMSEGALPVLLLVNDMSSLEESEAVFEVADDIMEFPVQQSVFTFKVKKLIRSSRQVIALTEYRDSETLQGRVLNYLKDQLSVYSDCSREIISRHRPDGSLYFVNDAVKETLGFDRNELGGRGYLRHIQEKDLQYLKAVTESLTVEQPERFVSFKMKTHTGDLVWLESKLKGVFSENDGVLKEIRISTRDITRLRKAEFQLEAKTQFVSFALENMPGIFYLIDDEMNYLLWNKRFEKELGYEADEIQDMSPLDFVADAYHEHIQGKISEVFENGSAEAEVALRNKTGEEPHYYLHGSCLQRNGRKYIVGSGVDISARKEAEFESWKLKKLMDAIVDQSHSVIYVKNEKGAYELVNNAFLKLFGLEQEDIVGKTDNELFGMPDDSGILLNDKWVRKTGEVLETEETVFINGKPKDFLTVKYLLSDVPGFDNCICGISTEITEQKALHRELEERAKEQNCLYKISEVRESDRTIPGLLNDALTFIPNGFQYPDFAEACIEFNGDTYSSSDFDPGEYRLSSHVNDLDGQSVQVHVIYSEEMPDADAGPFLQEEQQLINAICDALYLKIERAYSHNQLSESEERWENLVQSDPDLIIIYQDGLIKFINKSGADMYGADHPDQLIGKPLLNVVEMDKEDMARIRLKKALNGQKVKPFLYRIKNEKGREKHIQIQSVPVQYKGRPAVQIVGTDLSKRVKMEKRLKRSVQEKEVLLQEVHHRVKNNLAVVSGLLQIQQFETQNTELQMILEQSVNRIKSIALIHEKLYESDSLSSINFRSYMVELLGEFADSLGYASGVSFRLNADVIHLNVNQAVPAALIINELIINAVQHAFPDSFTADKMIEVSIFENKGRISVSVKDNGAGMPEEAIRGERQSMGSQIVNTLADQLYADLARENDGGHVVCFEFEKKTQKGSVNNFIA